MNRSTAGQSVDYDAVWKEVLQTYFRSWLAFLFPLIEAAIDWDTKPVFLNVELLKLSLATPADPDALTSSFKSASAISNSRLSSSM